MRFTIMMFIMLAMMAGYLHTIPKKEWIGAASNQTQLIKILPSSGKKRINFAKASPEDADDPEGKGIVDGQRQAIAGVRKKNSETAKPVVTKTPSPPALLQGTAPRLFDAELDKRKNLSAYAKTADPHSGMVINPNCITVVPDPVFGERRWVMELNVTNRDIGPTNNPRAQVQTPMQYTRGQEVWAAFSVLFPEEFPDFLSWMTLAEFYGAPYRGTSPFLIGCRMNKLILQHNSQQKPLWEEAIKKDRWYDILYRTVLSGDSSVGEVQVFMRRQGEGPAWREVLQGNMATITASNAEGPQYHKICNYRSLMGNWRHLDKTGEVTVTRIFLTNHRVGATRVQVEPAHL